MVKWIQNCLGTDCLELRRYCMGSAARSKIIHVICLCVSQGMFEPYLKSFYIRSTDPTQIKVLKVTKHFSH